MLVILLVSLHGPDGQLIEINPQAVVSLRDSRSNEHFAAGVKCLVHMNDGKLVTVTETCAEVNDLLREQGQE